MKLKNRLRQSTEAGIALTAIAALILAGCGGGSGNNANANTGVNNTVACSTTGNATGLAAADCLIAEMTSATGARVDWGSGASWVEPSTLLASTTTAGAYTLTFKYKGVNPAGTAWVSPANSPGYWDLTAIGWVQDVTSPDTIETLTNNKDGTLSSANSYSSYTLSSFVKTDLSGQGVVCKGGPRIDAGVPTVACVVATNYPSGAAAYSMVRTHNADSYYLFDGTSVGTPDVITNSAGVALTALPAVGTTVCINGTVYAPIAPAPAAGLDNYNLHLTADGSCGAGVISTAMAAAPTATALVASRTVNGAAMLTANQGGVVAIAAFNAQAGSRFMVGQQWRTAGSAATRYYVNKVAANAQLTAHGLPVLP